jgi:hypothetical protein
VGHHVLGSLPAHTQAVLTGHTFFPQLISAPFRSGLQLALLFAILACVIAAATSLMRGGIYHHSEASEGLEPQVAPAEAEAVNLQRA